MEKVTYKRLTGRTRYIWLVAGVAGSLFGLLLAIPGYLNYNYFLSILATVILIGSFIIGAIAFGDGENDIY